MFSTNLIHTNFKIYKFLENLYFPLELPSVTPDQTIDDE